MLFKKLFKKEGLCNGMRTFIGPASILKRVAAFFIDIIILEFFVLSSFERVVGKILPVSSFMEMTSYLENNPQKMMLLVVMAIIAGVFVVFYFTLFEWALWQTPGKMLVNIRIKEDNIGFWKILMSNLTFLPIFPFNVLWIVDPVHMFFSDKNQRLMEKWTGIEVIEEYSY